MTEEEKKVKSLTEQAAEEAQGRSTDVTPKANNSGISNSGNGANPMTRRGQVRQVGDTAVSGDIDVVANGMTLKDGWFNSDAGKISKGVQNLKTLYGSTPAYSSPKIKSVDADESGTITLDGTDSGLKAADYAGGASRTRETAQAWQKATGEQLAQVSTYSGLAALGDIVKYNDDEITIGGIPIPYAYIDNNGRAYASKTAIDAAIAQASKSTGIRNPTELTSDRLKQYQSNINSAMDKVINRKEWSYNPESDPAYQAYAREYLRNAEQLYNRAMGSGGLYSSPTAYQTYQAIAGYGDQMQKLTDQIPALAERAYQRYSDEQARNLQALNAVQSERQQDLAARTAANNSMYDRYLAQDQLNYSRRNDALYGDRSKQQELERAAQELQLGKDQLAQSAVTTDMYQANADTDYKLKQEQLSSAQADTLSKQVSNAMARAMANGGRYLKEDMDKLGIAQDLVKYPDTNGYPLVYTGELEQAKALWEQVEKPKAQYTASLNAMY